MCDLFGLCWRFSRYVSFCCSLIFLRCVQWLQWEFWENLLTCLGLTPDMTPPPCHVCVHQHIWELLRIKIHVRMFQLLHTSLEFSRAFTDYLRKQPGRSRAEVVKPSFGCAVRFQSDLGSGLGSGTPCRWSSYCRTFDYPVCLRVEGVCLSNQVLVVGRVTLTPEDWSEFCLCCTASFLFVPGWSLSLYHTRQSEMDVLLPPHHHSGRWMAGWDLQ